MRWRLPLTRADLEKQCSLTAGRNPITGIMPIKIIPRSLGTVGARATA